MAKVIDMDDKKDLGIVPKSYNDAGSTEDELTGHGRRKFEGQSIHGDTVRI